VKLFPDTASVAEIELPDPARGQGFPADADILVIGVDATHRSRATRVGAHPDTVRGFRDDAAMPVGSMDESVDRLLAGVERFLSEWDALSGAPAAGPSGRSAERTS
jgi:hypothetical protein